MNVALLLRNKLLGGLELYTDFEKLKFVWLRFFRKSSLMIEDLLVYWKTSDLRVK